MGVSSPAFGGSWMEKVGLFNFSIGEQRQSKYFKPHYIHITPYEDMVRVHKRKQKLKEEFDMGPDQ